MVTFLRGLSAVYTRRLAKREMRPMLRAMPFFHVNAPSGHSPIRTDSRFILAKDEPDLAGHAEVTIVAQRTIAHPQLPVALPFEYFVYAGGVAHGPFALPQGLVENGAMVHSADRVGSAVIRDWLEQHQFAS